ncbi:MAG: YdeI/OmpD-associated family protein [Opitutaceae bacterium]
MKRSPESQSRSFQSTLERLAPGIEYYAILVPAEITRALGTTGPVPVYARVNDSEPFLVSLYSRGGGRHGLRVKAEVRAEVKIKEGDRVRVQITVRERAAEASIPPDLTKILRAERVLEAFQALPIGQRTFTLRKIDQAVKPATREKRIQAAVALAHQRREQQSDRRA